jgi:diguanylate cyclase (GGDEF)-like protein
MSEVLMVGNGENIGSPQLFGPGLSRTVRKGGSALLTTFGDPNRVLAVMLAVGGVQGLVLLAMPHWRVDHPLIILGVTVASLVGALFIWLSRRRLGPRNLQVVSGIGLAIVSLAVFGCGPEPASLYVAYVYFLIVLYSAAYFSPVAAAGHLAAVGVLYAVALALHPVAAFPGQWIQAMLALSVTALIVGGYAFQVRRSAAALNFQAFHDTLTGLGNRALFLNRVDDALRRTDGRADQVAVLFLDVDDFKTVNDSLGHPIGDQLLTALAGCLGSLTRPGDTLARLGGDEFGMLLESGPMPQTVEELAVRIAAMLAAPFQLGGTEVTISVSIGISVALQSQSTSEELLREVDLAMYLAKQNGKGGFEIIRPGMLDDAFKHLAVITDLRHAVVSNEFEVFYQPVVGVRDAIPVGAEALVRWHHPQRGLVAPAEFVGVAESTGLIVAIGDWVLNEACRQAQAWRQTQTIDDAFYVSVNLSPRQLVEPKITDDVARALRQSGLPPSALVLEITETALMLDFDASVVRLQSLKDLGVRLAMDDFGTGYSSLNRLRSLPIDIVKIDKSFIDEVGHEGQDRALVQSIIHITHALGMTSVAEGVEKPDQYDALGELGCDAIQGYLFARPQSAVDTGRTLLRLAAGQVPTRS